MACSKPNDRSGYATPAAMIISLGLAMVAVAATARGAAALRMARSDMDQARMEYALAGAQTLAALKVMDADHAQVMRWSLPTDAGDVAVLAEPEAGKLSLTTAAQLNDAVLGKFAVGDAAALRGRLTVLAATAPGNVEIADADPASLWRACAPSLISPYGQAVTLSPNPATAAGEQPSSGRVGEVWRIKVAAADGWSDDRLVRFTGDAQRPSAVVSRRWAREGATEGQCDSALKLG